MQTNTETEKSKNGFKNIFSDKKRCIIFFVCLSLICIFAILTALSVKVSAYDKIYPNIFVEGINLGGLTKEEAALKLHDEYVPKFNEKEYTIVLADFTGTPYSPKRSVKIKASDIDAVPDIDMIADAVYKQHRSKNFYGRMFSYYKNKWSSENWGMPNTVNSEKINAIVTALADGFETPVQETSYYVEGDILTISNGHGGETVDRLQAENLIKNTVFSLKDDEIILTVERAEPKKINVDEFYSEITNAQKDAYYDRVGGAIVVVDDFPKVEFNKSELKKALESGQESYKITVKTTPAKVTRKDLEAMLFKDKMGSWTSTFSASNVPRSSNVRLTASRINGITLLPGEVFSYDSTIGKRTIENGYKVAGVYVGNKVEEGIGGGICQTSSTLYSAVLYSNLEIVSRTSHSLPVSYMPPGQDATIAEGYIDFKFKNNTEYPIKIVCTTSNSSVTCSILGVKPEGETVEIVNTRTSTSEPKTVREFDETIPKGYKKISQKGAIGYNIASQRIVKMNGVEKKRENLTKSVYKASDTIELVNPLDKDTPTEELRIYDPIAYYEEQQKEQSDSVNTESSEEVQTSETVEPQDDTPEDVQANTVMDIEINGNIPTGQEENPEDNI